MTMDRVIVKNGVIINGEVYELVKSNSQDECYDCDINDLCKNCCLCVELFDSDDILSCNLKKITK